MMDTHTLGTRLRHALVNRLRRRGKLAFLQSLPARARVLDVGCGNNSPRDAKILRPDLVYTGLDIGDYNQQDSIRYADAYILVTPAGFAGAIAAHEGRMDAVVSSHNLEHCDDPVAVLDAMVTALRPGGRLFLAFPCEASVRFPSRKGTLNFFDDGTHKAVPQWEAVLEGLRARGMILDYACRRYRPPFLAALGFVLEPLGRMLGRSMPAGATWALYGFETVIWGRREGGPQAPACLRRQGILRFFPPMSRSKMEPSRSARQAFGRLSDSRWLKVLKRSIKEPVIDGVILPGFPPDALQRRTVGSSYEHTLDEASAFYTYVKDACAKHASSVRQGSEILDFGVSWGRIIRFFMKDVDPGTLHGVDTSEDFLEAARQTGIPGHLHRIDPLGRLPYPDRSFDLAYAYSVFTHLPENVQDHWLAEIARTLKPGALLVATVEAPRFLDYFAPLDPQDKDLHPWHAEMARKIRADPGLKTRLQDSGFVYLPQRGGVNEVYGDCVMTPRYVREHWGRWFEVVDYLDDPKRFWQAVVIARMR